MIRRAGSAVNRSGKKDLRKLYGCRPHFGALVQNNLSYRLGALAIESPKIARVKQHDLGFASRVAKPLSAVAFNYKNSSDISSHVQVQVRSLSSSTGSKKHPVLDAAETYGQDYLSVEIKASISDVYLVCVQHLLPSTVTLFEKLLKLGFKPEKIYLTGKPYSTCPDSVKKLKELDINVYDPPGRQEVGKYLNFMDSKLSNLWGEIVNKKVPLDAHIVCLDEGGRLIQTAPHKRKPYISGIEQTRGGLYNGALKDDVLMCPVVNLAASEVKKEHETPIIARTVIDAIEKHGFKQDAQVGVLGCGVVGRAIIDYFLKQEGFSGSIIVYDKDNLSSFPPSVMVLDSAKKVVLNSDVVVGAVGTDVLKAEKFGPECVLKNISFISGSSEDKEFKSLLKACAKRASTAVLEPMRNLVFKAGEDDQFTIKFCFGGFPINFSLAPDDCDPYAMELTRALLYLSVCQALKGLFCENKVHGLVDLDNVGQEIIEKAYIGAYGKPESQTKTPDEKQQEESVSSDAVKSASTNKCEDELSEDFNSKGQTEKTECIPGPIALGWKEESRYSRHFAMVLCLLLLYQYFYGNKGDARAECKSPFFAASPASKFSLGKKLQLGDDQEACTT